MMIRAMMVMEPLLLLLIFCLAVQQIDCLALYSPCSRAFYHSSNGQIASSRVWRGSITPSLVPSAASSLRHRRLQSAADGVEQLDITESLGERLKIDMQAASSASALDSSGYQTDKGHDGHSDHDKRTTIPKSLNMFDKDKGKIPSYMTMLKFVLPTLGIWISSPIMSLVDTSVVGTQSSLELAALGPATAVCDSLIYAFGFLAVATTNLQAAALAKDDELESRRESQNVVSNALAIACACGLFVFFLVQAGCPWLLHMATNGRNPGVIPAAARYIRLRIIGAPACVAAMVAQAACLGSKDPLTPLIIVLCASAFNGVADVLLAITLKMGIGGAALGTAGAELLSAWLLVKALLRTQGPRLVPFIKLPTMEELMKFAAFAGPIFFALLGKVICYTYMTIVVTTCGNVPLATHTVMLRLFFLGTTVGDSLSQTAQAFLPGIFAKDQSNMKKWLSSRHQPRNSQPQSSGNADTVHTLGSDSSKSNNETSEHNSGSSSSGGGDDDAKIAVVAATTNIASATSVTTPTLPSSSTVADITTAGEEAPAVRPRLAGDRLIWRLFRLGCVVGLVNGIVSLIMPLQFPHFFTNDVLIVKEIALVAPLLFASLLGHSCVMALEGILLAKRQLIFLANIYAINTSLMVGFLYWVLKRAGGGRGGLIMVWWGLLGFQVVRFIQFVGWMFVVKRKENAQVAATMLADDNAAAARASASSTLTSTTTLAAAT